MRNASRQAKPIIDIRSRIKEEGNDPYLQGNEADGDEGEEEGDGEKKG